MAILNSAAIISALNNYGKPGSQGGAAHLRRTAAKYPEAPASQKQFVADVEAAPIPRTQGYDHPGRQMRGTPNPDASLTAGEQAYNERHGSGSGTGQPLSAADIAWLQRLPADPAAVTYNDARDAIAMRDRKLSPDEARLVASIADPILEHHDYQAALVNLSNARRAPLPLPLSAVPALAHAVSAEVPELTADEAVGRAHGWMDRITADRLAAYNKRLQQANDELNAVRERTAQRTATAQPTIA